MEKIARFSVKYPTTILMIVLAIILLGIISFQRLGMDLFPDLNSPRLFIEVKAGERPPQEMETQFVLQLESIAARGRKVENVSSVSRVGHALITVEYSWNADMDEAFLDLQKNVADFSQNNSADEITVSQHDPNARPMLIAVFSNPNITDLDQLRRTAENNVVTELIRLPGIAEVNVIGDRKRQIEVKTDAYTLQAYGLTSDQLAGAIQNANRNMTGGSIVEMGIRYVIRGIGEFANLDDIRNLIITYRTTEDSSRIPIYLRDVADVSYTLSDPENIVTFNGHRCLALEIYREAKYNTIDASEGAYARLKTLRQALPGYELKIIQDQAKFIRSAVTEVEQTGLIGILLAVLVLFVFLRRIGVTMVISIAIPISVVATFNLMYFNNLSLNIMTLGGLALGAGMLVDNAIVVMENIFRHLEEGKPLLEACVVGTGEVGGAIASSTLTTIIVFLPIIYLRDAAGELFRDQAWTVAFSLISSLFVALAVIPMLCSKLLKSSTPDKSITRVLFPGYAGLLKKILNKRKQVITFAFALLLVTVAIIPLIGSEFMPKANQGELSVALTLPEGTSLERTAATAKGVSEMIKQHFAKDIAYIYTKIGPTGTSINETDALTDENNAVIHLAMNKDAALSATSLVAGIDNIVKNIPDVEARITLEQTALQSTLGTTSAPVTIEIKGNDLDVLADLADTVKARLLTVGSLVNIETSFQEGRPEVNLQVDRIRAAQFSLSVNDIGSQLKNVLSGRDVGKMEDNGEYANIKITHPDMSIDELEHILLESSSGKTVRLDEVTRIEQSYAPREILRNNQSRIARITAQIAGDIPFNKVAKQVASGLSSISFPPEYSYAVTGEEKLRAEAFSGLKFALILAIVLVYMVMAAQFESLLHPFVILLTIPLAVIGAVFLLLITGIPFNIMSYIGLIMLAGIAVNDSIILVDRINQNRRGGLPLIEAITNAGQTRIRPIIMTSVTTILALLPLTFGLGEGASLRAPMAVAVIGGLFSSTALTLLVIPAVYYILAGKSRLQQNEVENSPL